MTFYGFILPKNDIFEMMQFYKQFWKGNRMLIQTSIYFYVTEPQPEAEAEKKRKGGRRVRRVVDATSILIEREPSLANRQR